MAELRPGALYTPNVEKVRGQATWVIQGKLPREVRKELMAGVKAGHLGHLKKDGLKPEVFYNPSHYYGALERQEQEAQFAIECIRKVCVIPSEI